MYHPGYKAKRLETGFVVGGAPRDMVYREKPKAGDVIILLGGETGRDGCGGATGSSKAHDAHSVETCGAEVQKGNPLTERKLQRLFLNKEATRRIKKCNDFGAGGVSVAIGELSDGLVIELDKVPLKYEGLSGTELAISESQESHGGRSRKGGRRGIYPPCRGGEPRRNARRAGHGRPSHEDVLQGPSNCRSVPRFSRYERVKTGDGRGDRGQYDALLR